MVYGEIVVTRDEGVTVITLNRPRTLNAVGTNMMRELNAALDGIAADNTSQVLIITGAPRPDGRPCFSAGMDLKEAAESGRRFTPQIGIVGAAEALSSLASIESGFQLLCDRLESFSKATIAAIDGVCTAGGLELALCCDLRVVSETAQISDLHLKNLGTIGGAGATVRLTRLVGAAKAKEIVLTGEPVDGREAWRIGLANRVVSPSRLMPEAKALGKRIAGMNGEGVRMAKSSINASLDMDLREALRYSYLCVASIESGVQARVESFVRKP